MPNPARTITHRFGNGLTLLIREEHTHPVTSVQFWVQTGSCHEGARLGSGLSHLLEHMVFKGTRNMSGQELAERVQENGGLWNAYTSTNRTVYYIDGPSKSWASFAEVLSELVFNPSFPADELEKEKDVIRREMDMYDDDPDSVAYKLLMQTLYKKNPRRHPVLGDLDSFNLLTREDMTAYHKARYCPNNVFIVVTGDVKADEVIAAIGNLTADVEPQAINNPAPAREPHQWGRRTARQEFAVPYSKLNLAWRIPEQSHPDTPALSMLSRVLGSGRSARLYRILHDELGLVHDIAVSANTGFGEEGVFSISVDVDRSKRDEARERILEELALIANEDLSADISRSIKRTKSSRLAGMATVSGLAESIATQWFHARNTDYYDEWIEAFEQVTNADLHRVTASWLKPGLIIETSLDPLGSNTENTEAEDKEKRNTLETFTLPNGLQVILREDHRLPMAYGFLAFKAGVAFEDEHTAGITSILAECMLKGTATKSAQQIAQGLEDLGGYIDSNSGNNSMGFRFNVLSEDLEAGLELLADVVRHPALPADAFERERQSALSDAEERLEDPLAVAFDQASKLCYGNNSYGLPASGTLDSLEQMELAQLRAHYKRHVCASNAVFSLVGSFESGKAVKLIEQYLGAIAAGKAPAFTPSPVQNSGETVNIMDKEQAVLVMSMPGVDVCSDYRAHESLLHAWCADMAGPIFTGIREEAGLAYYASSHLFMGLDTGNIMFYLGTSETQLDEARAKLDEILDHIYHTGISHDEFERVRSSALSAQLLAGQSNSTLSQRLALDVLYGLPADNFERQEELLAQITLEEMNNFIKQYLSPGQPRILSIVKNK